MAYRFLIADDERLSRGYLRDLIREMLPDAVIMEADGAESALRVLQVADVDVLFLDIRMPGQDGFSLLQDLKKRTFQLVFVTAYSQYAIPAIRQGAADYLLKPVKKSEFKAMLARILGLLAERDAVPATTDRAYPEGQLSLSHQQGIRLIRLRDIIYLKADNSYTTFHLAGGEKFMTSKPISYYAEQLNGGWFFRIHKSYLINMAHFREYQSRNGAYAMMDDSARLQISRYRLSDFLSRLKSGTGTSLSTE